MLLLGMFFFFLALHMINACVLSLPVSQYTRTRGFFKMFLKVKCGVRVTALSPGSYMHYVFPLSPLFFPRHPQLATIRASCKVGRNSGLRLYRSFYIMHSEFCRAALPTTDKTPFLTKQWCTIKIVHMNIHSSLNIPITLAEVFITMYWSLSVHVRWLFSFATPEAALMFLTRNPDPLHFLP